MLMPFMSLPKDHQIDVYTMDHQGHGRSEGLHGYIESLELLVGDFSQFVKSVAARNVGIPVFLCGLSMGGAVVLFATLEDGPLHGVVRGVVALAPMCELAETMRLPPWKVFALKALANIGPTWPITPAEDMTVRGYRDPIRYREVTEDPLCYHAKLRLRTAAEIHDAIGRIGARLDDVIVPFIVMHGDADTVTCPTVSKHLYERGKSTDKTFKTYDGAYHVLIAEPDGVAERVIADAAAWILARVV
jgi:alpha-beta hydrolase superfamily lysophospholipase